MSILEFESTFSWYLGLFVFENASIFIEHGKITKVKFF